MTQRIDGPREGANLRVGVFGYLKYGNFGDDLMAFMFARALKEEGCDVTVYAIHQRIADEIGVPKVDDLAAFVAGVDVVVYSGGGAFLTGSSQPGSEGYDFDTDAHQLVELCSRARKPIHMFSVGGDGTGNAMSPVREELLHGAESITFRNPEDAGLVARRGGRRSKIHADIVWLVSSLFPQVGQQPRRRIALAVDLAIISNWKTRLVIGVLHAAAILHPNFEPISYLNQHLRPSRRRRFCRKVDYEDVAGYVREVAAMDLVITSRLHTGMTAMSFGIPVIQIRPQPKARMLFERMGRKHMIARDGVELLQKMFVVMIAGRRARYMKKFAADLARLQDDAGGHFADLRSVVAFERARKAGSSDPD